MLFKLNLPKGSEKMATRPVAKTTTSSKASAMASKVLRSPGSSKTAKTAAGSTLSQKPFSVKVGKK
jgi:hypothetical protein